MKSESGEVAGGAAGGIMKTCPGFLETTSSRFCVSFSACVRAASTRAFGSVRS